MQPTRFDHVTIQPDNPKPANHIAVSDEVGSPASIGPRGVVLVVDDEQVNRELLARLVRRNGLEAMLAKNGAEALVALESHPIDMVLLDIVMPLMDGFEVLSQVRRSRTAAELPIIMVTGDGDTAKVVEALRHGANDFVTKPIDPDMTIARINTHLNVRQLQSALAVSEERYALASRGANDGLWDCELSTGKVYFSQRWKEMLGFGPAHEIESMEQWFALIHEEDCPRVRAELQSHLDGAISHFETELRILHSDDGYRWMLCRGLAVRDAAGNANRIAGSLTDITEGKVADALTGLPNRLLFRDRLQRTIDRARAGVGGPFAVLYFDLDNFKLVNDSLGHAAGDQLLVGVAHRLEGCVRACESIVARIGGDEFAILLEQSSSPQQAESIAQRLTDAIAAPFTLGSGREVFTSASIGITHVCGRDVCADDLLREADTAMYDAKEHGKSQFQIFSPVMHEEANRRLDLESELRRAVEREEIYLHFQPIVELRSGKPLGFEALARWKHPRLGMVSPGEFIPIAEETGLIMQIGARVMEMACEQMGRWQRVHAAARTMTLNVNLSARQLSQTGLVADILRVLDETGFDATRLRIEITESAIMENLRQCVDLLATLRKSGMRIEIDDFGTGYSSLALLHKLPLDVLKIDRGFVNHMLRSLENTAIVHTILGLAESLRLDVIAEGIETEAQRDRLLSMGCGYGQGYLFSKPLDAGQADDWLRHHGERTISTPPVSLPIWSETSGASAIP